MLGLLKLDMCKQVKEKQCSSRQQQRRLRTFTFGQKVLTRDYCGPTQKWQSGVTLRQDHSLTLWVWGPTWSRADMLTTFWIYQLEMSLHNIDTPLDSENILMTPHCAYVNSDTQNPETMNPVHQGVTKSNLYNATLRGTVDPLKDLIYGCPHYRLLKWLLTLKKWHVLSNIFFLVVTDLRVHPSWMGGLVMYSEK